MHQTPEIVWLLEERTFAVVVSLNAHFAVAKYTRGGIEYEVEVTSDEFELWEERAIDYETE